MTLTLANTNLYIAHCTLSDTIDHYKTRDNPSLDYQGYLRSLWQPLGCRRPPAKLSNLLNWRLPAEPLIVLARPLQISCDPETVVGPSQSLQLTYRDLPAGWYRASIDPIPTFGRLLQNPITRSYSSLGSAIANPSLFMFTHYLKKYV